MYNIHFDHDYGTKADRDANGHVVFRRVKKLGWNELWDGRPAWFDGDKVPSVLRDEYHQWFVDQGIPYELNWRWDHKQIISGQDTPTNFRWEVDILDPKDAVLVKLTWAL